MKKISLFLTFLFSVLLLSAQDIIVKNSGETIKAYNLEASGTSVFFQLSAEPDAPLQKLPKTEILVVRKADGTKLDFDAPAPQPTAQQQQTATAQNKPIKLTLDMLSEEEKAENERLIKQYNEPVKFTVKKEGKEVTCLYACFCPKQTSIITNKDLALSLVTGGMTYGTRSSPSVFQEWNPVNEVDWHPPYYAVLKITNKTDQALYVDLGNTMLVVQGKSVPFYIPQTTTTSNTSVGGGSVNLGALTGSSLLGGISLGGGNASSTVSTVFSQRVVAVAPFGTLVTPAVALWGGKRENREIVYGIDWVGEDVSAFNGLKIFLPKKSVFAGQVIDYNEENAPLNISAYLSYSYTEDCAQENTMSSYYFLKQLIGVESYRDFTKFTAFPCTGTKLFIYQPKKSNLKYFPLP